MNYKLNIEAKVDYTQMSIMAGELYLIDEKNRKTHIAGMALGEENLHYFFIENNTKFVFIVLDNVLKNGINNWCTQVAIADIETETITFYDKYFINNGEKITYKNGIITVHNENNDFAKTDSFDIKSTAVQRIVKFKKLIETHKKNIFKIPDFYKVMVDNIITDENPRYHTTTVLWVHYNYYTLTLNYLNKGNGYYSYELIVDFSNPQFYEVGNPRLKPLPPMYETTWDFDGTLHVFQKEYQSIEASANDVNFYLANAKIFEETLLENASGFDSKSENDISIQKKIIQVFTNPEFEQHRFKFNKIFDEKELNTANYKVFEFEKNECLFHIALNNHKPYLAMIKDFEPTKIVQEFYGIPIEQSYALQNIGITFPTNILELTLEKPFINQLTDYEMKQIKHWKAKTFSELLFNKWD